MKNNRLQSLVNIVKCSGKCEISACEKCLFFDRRLEIPVQLTNGKTVIRIVVNCHADSEFVIKRYDVINNVIDEGERRLLYAKDQIRSLIIASS